MVVVRLLHQTSVSLYDNNIKHLRITNGKFTRTIGLLKYRYMYPTAILQAFIEHCYRYFNHDDIK